MLNHFKQITLAQYEAALTMLHDAITICPEEQWDARVGRYAFWHIAYHTLCFTDLYLSPTEADFELRPDIHPKGMDELGEEYPSRRFERDELLAYVIFCRDKALTTLPESTESALTGPSGHERRNFSRAELHLCNIRHIMHHTGQLHLHLRRQGESFQSMDVMKWGHSGWHPGRSSPGVPSKTVPR